MKKLTAAVLVILLVAGLVEAGGIGRWLLNYPSDFAVIGALVWLVITGAIGVRLLLSVIRWGLLPATSGATNDQADTKGGAQ